MKSFGEFRISETFLLMNWSFGTQRCCPDTEAWLSGYASTNSVKQNLFLKSVRILRFPDNRCRDMRGSTVSMSIPSRVRLVAWLMNLLFAWILRYALLIFLFWPTVGPSLVTWIDFNPHIDKKIHAQLSVRWNHLSDPRLQRCSRWSLRMRK